MRYNSGSVPSSVPVNDEHLKVQQLPEMYWCPHQNCDFPAVTSRDVRRELGAKVQTKAANILFLNTCIKMSF